MKPFQFQQFSVIQKDSGMKVCTDATLFGAMAPVAPGDRVLDIGTGTGLLALMAAQLGAATVVGVELTLEACREAEQNFFNSPWGERLRLVPGDIRDSTMESLGEFDLVISNPPFFDRHTGTTDVLRNMARHNGNLSHPELIRHAVPRLSPKGLLYVLLPVHAVGSFQAIAAEHGLHPVYRTDIRGYVHKPPKVSVLTLGRSPVPPGYRLLTIYDGERVYARESTHYLSPFLLRFASGEHYSMGP
jgi:tRNA1Val (adenine37-N6)-methyltransferase